MRPVSLPPLAAFLLFAWATVAAEEASPEKGSATVINNAPRGAPLEKVVEFPDRQVTGVTVIEDGRLAGHRS